MSRRESEKLCAAFAALSLFAACSLADPPGILEGSGGNPGSGGRGLADAGDGSAGGAGPSAGGAKASGGGSAVVDGGGGSLPAEGGTPDAGAGGAAPVDDHGIGAVLAAAASGVKGASLPVKDVVVTYLLPAGNGAGFFVQAGPGGPALFLAIDPASFVPRPAVGDRVSFNVAAASTVAGQHRVTQALGYARSATGVSLDGFIADVTDARDLVTAKDSYESEMVRAEVAISSDFQQTPPYTTASIDTSGVVGNTRLRLLIPETLRASLDLSNHCAVSLLGTPLYPYYDLVEIPAFAATDITVIACPSPEIVELTRVSATSLRVVFDRKLDPSSLVGAGQITFGGGLTATAVSLGMDGRTLTVTTTAQTPGASYQLSVASSVKSQSGAVLGASAKNYSFVGFQPLAKLLINEVQWILPTGIGGLIELRATASGSLGGIALQLDLGTPTTLARLPDLVVASGDLVVVRLSPSDGVITETYDPSGCGDPDCFDGAWDVRGTSLTVAPSNRVLQLVDPGGTPIDSVAMTAMGSSNVGFPADYQTLVQEKQWSPAQCGSQPCDYYTTPSLRDVTVDFPGDGASSSRTAATDTNTKNDFTYTATMTIGAPN